MAGEKKRDGENALERNAAFTQSSNLVARLMPSQF